MVLQFLSLFAEEADTVGIAEETAYPLLGSYMVEPADLAFRSAKGRGKAGVSCYPEAVNWLLNTYCTPAVLRSAAASMKNLAQKNGETEVDFGTRLRLAANRCGNAFDEEELMSIFIDGLDPRIRPYVARYRESRPRDDSTLDILISFARDEGDGLRARFGRNTRAVASKVNFVDELPSVHSYNVGNAEAPDPIGLIGDGMKSQDTDDLPSTVEDLGADSILYGESREYRRGRKMVMPPRIPYEERNSRSTRVGWVAPREYPTGQKVHLPCVL